MDGDAIAAQAAIARTSMDLFIASPPGRVVNTEIDFHGLREGVSAYADTRATRRGGVRSAGGAEDFDDGATAAVAGWPFHMGL